MGDYLRQYCATQPPPAVRPYSERRGDVLPIHPGAISTELEEVDSKNLHWLKSTVMVLNYLYCRGRVKPTGVPIAPSLCMNQVEAAHTFRKRAEKCLAGESKVLSTTAVDTMFEDIQEGELGTPALLLRKLDAEKVITSWPPENATESLPILSLLDGRLSGARCVTPRGGGCLMTYDQKCAQGAR